MRNSLKEPSLYIYFIPVGLLFVALKVFYMFAITDDLLFILEPIASLVSFFTNDPYTFLPDDGFHYYQLNIVIDKSCSGFNFGCLCFVALSISLYKYVKHRRKPYFVLPILFIISYGFTILVNTSRILLAILVNKLFHYSGVAEPSWLHLLEGVFVYLFSLILIYLLSEFIVSKIISRHDESA